MLQCSKEEHKDLLHAYDYDNVLYLQKCDAVKFCMMVCYQSHLSTNGLFPEDIDTSRFNSITIKDCVSFVRHPDAIALVSSTDGMTTTPPANTGLSDNFKVAFSAADSFKIPSK